MAFLPLQLSRCKQSLRLAQHLLSISMALMSVLQWLSCPGSTEFPPSPNRSKHYPTRPSSSLLVGYRAFHMVFFVLSVVKRVVLSAWYVRCKQEMEEAVHHMIACRRAHVSASRVKQGKARQSQAVQAVRHKHLNDNRLPHIIITHLPLASRPITNIQPRPLDPPVDMTEPEDHFTIFIRLPFARGDFVDPPPVDWSATKERELWEVLSKSSKGHEIDWRSLSHRFKVTEAFLLQQAAWLYERQLSQVRAQMRKMGNRSSNTASPAPQSNAASVVGGYPMKRTGSGGSRVPSRLSTHVSTAETSVPATPVKGRSSFPNRTAPQPKPDLPLSRPLSRHASKETDVASRTHSRRGSVQHQVTRSPVQEVSTQPDSSSEEDMTQSRMLHRRPNPAASRRTVQRRSQHSRRPSAPQLDEEDEDDSPAFLPFSDNTTQPMKPDQIVRDSNVTLRGGIAQTPRPNTHRRSTSERILPGSAKARDQLASSTDSGPEVSIEPARATPHLRQTSGANLPNPLSPRQQAALAAAAGLSPRLRRQGTSGHNGSDTSPSMGSSFSDLDDTSVTQSALEEALLSGMGNTTMTVNAGPSGTLGNVAHRVSGISQGLRSRYFDAKSGESHR